MNNYYILQDCRVDSSWTDFSFEAVRGEENNFDEFQLDGIEKLCLDCDLDACVGRNHKDCLIYIPRNKKKGQRDLF